MCVYAHFTVLTVLSYCRSIAVSRLVNGVNVAVGVVSCLAIYPCYLLVFTLFRMSCNKVTHTYCTFITHTPLHPSTHSSHLPQNALESLNSP